MDIDRIDEKLIAALRRDGRISNAKLADEVGLSASACLRRMRQLEAAGIIRGYTALIDRPERDQKMVCVVEIVLERQTDEYFTRFETAIRRSADIRECYLMTGDYDYLVRVEAADPADYERIHRDQLAKLPGVSRIRTAFAIRKIVSG
jgi:DNA-binding Lrp family transcriptional regulator